MPTAGTSRCAVVFQKSESALTHANGSAKSAQYDHESHFSKKIIMPGIHFECSKCTQRIDAVEELAGQLVVCPTCKATVKVPNGFLKCVCQHCGQHVEFPEYGAGSTVPCPSCSQPVLLAVTNLQPKPIKKATRSRKKKSESTPTAESEAAMEEQRESKFQDVSITILAKSSSGGKYKVTFIGGETTVRVHCSCRAGSCHQLCYHKLKMSAGCEELLFDPYQREMLLTALSWAQCNSLRNILQSMESKSAQIRDMEVNASESVSDQGNGFLITTRNIEDYDSYKRLQREHEIIKEALESGLFNGIGPLTEKALQEQLASIPTRQQEVQYLAELGFNEENLHQYETTSELLMRVLRPLDYAITGTIYRSINIDGKQAVEIPIEHIIRIQIAISHWDYCPKLPRYGPHSTWVMLESSTNNPHRSLTKNERKGVLDLICRVVPPDVFLSLKVKGIESYKHELDEKIKSGIVP